MFGKTAMYMRYMMPGAQADWAVRRALVFLCVFFSMGLIIYGCTERMSEARALMIVPQTFTFLTFVVAYYVFGPIADDYLKNRGVMAPPAPGTANPPQPPIVAEQGAIPLDPQREQEAPIGRGAGM